MLTTINEKQLVEDKILGLVEQFADFNEYKYNLETPEGTTFFSIKATFGDGYQWSRLLRSITKYGQMLFEAYWYDVSHNGGYNRAIRRGEYIVTSKNPTSLKKSLTWIRKMENITLEFHEEDKNKIEAIMGLNGHFS